MSAGVHRIRAFSIFAILFVYLFFNMNDYLFMQVIFNKFYVLIFNKYIKINLLCLYFGGI